MSAREAVKEVIASTLSERFDEVEIVTIDIMPDTDEDGEPVLFVRVVFDGKEQKRLDPQKTSGLARRVIPRLAEAGENGFPIFSFIRKSEWGGKNPEAA